MSDRERQSAGWMTALAQGDDAPLALLIEHWQQPVLRFVYRYVQNEADACDLVQETFVRVYANRHTFRSGAPFASWLFTIAANLCRNHMRTRGRRGMESLDAVGADRVSSTRPSPDDALLNSERVQAVRDAIAALPHDLKVTLLLQEYENLSYAEIASVVGCSVKGVEARLARARQRLRDALARYLDDGDALLRAGPQVLGAGLLATKVSGSTKLAPTGSE